MQRPRCVLWQLCCPMAADSGWLQERCWQQDLFTTLVMLGVTPGLAVAANIFWGLWAFHTFLACTGMMCCVACRAAGPDTCPLLLQARRRGSC